MQDSVIDKQLYSKMADLASPNSNIVVNCLKAFFVGGGICAVSEMFRTYLSSFDFTNDEVSLIINIVLIGITALLTGMGLFSKIGKFSGAGTFVPITGFAKSMVSPAVEFKKEGWILGLAAKIFTVAGPVIVYGILSSMLVGFAYFYLGKVM